MDTGGTLRSVIGWKYKKECDNMNWELVLYVCFGICALPFVTVILIVLISGLLHLFKSIFGKRDLIVINGNKIWRK